MSIKVRLILSYLAMLLVPICLSIVTAFLVGSYYTGNLFKSFGNEFRIYPLRQALDQRNQLFSEIKRISLQNPEQLLDEDFLHRLEEEFIIFETGVLIRRGNEIIYSSPLLKDFYQESQLPAFGEYRHDIDYSFPKGERNLLVDQHDFYFSDHSEGTLFWVVDMAPLREALQQISGVVTVCVVLILVITNGALTYVVAGGIIRPLERLKASANEIKSGNLDFKIQGGGKDEIGELCRAFEEMRARLKESLDRQIQYEENRKELISNISHDLKTPVTSIKGYIEGILDGVADTPEKMERYLNTIYQKTMDVDRLIDELFLYSKLDLNRLPLHLTPINLVAYLQDLVEELSFDLEKKGMTITFAPEVDHVQVLADGKQLKRVLVNIVENSCKYMGKPQGQVTITVTDAEDYTQVMVEDNGKGIPQESLPFIFDRFYRTDPSRNNQTGGSGLGLAIAKKIIEDHGGKMWAESELGVGTRIYLTLKKEGGALNEKSAYHRG